MDYKELLLGLSLEEKVALCSGSDFWHTKGLKHFNIPALMLADGPHGLRKQLEAADMLGVNESLPATCFPTAVSTACSWDEGLLGEIGQAVALEAQANGVGLVLGPGANIKRNPLCGRNFEYFSEDPYLSGRLSASYIKRAEATGIGTCLKHFALNSQEYKRFSSDSVADERTMREIYLAGFEMAVKEGKPSAVMSSYNVINGKPASGNKYLLTEVLRDEWGFEGMVVTDWGGMNNRIEGFEAGCDLVMPGGSAYMEAETIQAVKRGVLEETAVDKCAARVIRLITEKNKVLENPADVNMGAHHELACRAAAESAVLMKNDDGLLPLSSKQKLLFIGDMAKNPRYQGSGSSHINPWKLVSVTELNPEIPFVQGCDADGNTTEELISEAVKAAESAEAVVIFAGLPDKYESEGFDRDNMHMPEGQLKLIEAVAKVNSNTAVVLASGSAVEMPFADSVKAILYVGLSGQGIGEAISRLLFGKAVPCGKLAETWPVKYEDCISSTYYSAGHKDAHYREGVYVGYRYYSSADVPVKYSFGHGLSYTNFEYSDLEIDGNQLSYTVTNTGKYSAKEISQVYIMPPRDNVYRPVKELKAFAKTELAPNESKRICHKLSPESFAVWQNGWVVPRGSYGIAVGAGSEDIRLTGTIEVAGAVVTDNVPNWYYRLNGIPSHSGFEALVGRRVRDIPLKKGDFTMMNTVKEMKDFSGLMKLIYKGAELVIARGLKIKRDYTNPVFRMMMSSAVDSSLSAMRINSGMKNYLLEGALSMANGHFFKGLKIMFKRIK